ncbi:MAG: YciI family protein [Polyangiales bacterium]
MKFMLMMQGTCTGWESMSSWSPADFKAHIAFMLNFNKELSAAGELVSAEGLDIPAKAKVVRAKAEGAPAVTDGPFPETKEFLAGYWIVDVETQERAIEIAAKASAAPGKGGAPINIPIEVRQVMCAPPLEL